MPELGFIGRYARLGALVALLSGCGATHQASQGEPAIERQGLREALPFTALAGSEGPLADPYGGEHARLAAVLAGGLPSDLLKFNDGRLVVDFIGGTRAEKRDAYALASPARQITPQAPPFFLFHGRWDRLVPVDHATDFYAALQAQGTPSELYLQRGRGHFASFLLRGSAIEAGIAFLNQQVQPEGRRGD